MSYNLHINCGGQEVIINGIRYEDDSDTGGGARFIWKGKRNWAVITTGNFLTNDGGGKYLPSSNSLPFIENVALYKSARASPISLTYYGFCLLNGNYTVVLHFAEIVFIDGETYSSLGRRVFDIYIQVWLTNFLTFIIGGFHIENGSSHHIDCIQNMLDCFPK